MQLDKTQVDFFKHVEEAFARLFEPLKQLGVHCFTFIRQFPDRSDCILSSSSRWVEEYYSSRLFESSLYINNPKQYPTGFYVWPMESDLDVFKQGRLLLNSEIGITITQDSEAYKEFYFFSWSRDAMDQFNSVLNNKIYLYQFLAYFKKEGKALIDSAQHHHRVILPSKTSVAQEVPKEIMESIGFISQELKVSPIDTFQTMLKHQDRYTPKELECVYFLLQGYTAKECAKKLQVSHRTVETHYENVKLKLDCHKKLEIVSAFMREEFGVLI